MLAFNTIKIMVLSKLDLLISAIDRVDKRIRLEYEGSVVHKNKDASPRLRD